MTYSLMVGCQLCCLWSGVFVIFLLFVDADVHTYASLFWLFLYIRECTGHEDIYIIHSYLHCCKQLLIKIGLVRECLSALKGWTNEVTSHFS